MTSSATYTADHLDVQRSDLPGRSLRKLLCHWM